MTTGKTLAWAGLIGLSAGQSILWPDRGGAEHRLTIVAVKRPVG